MRSGFEILCEIFEGRTGFHVVFDRNEKDEFILNVRHLPGKSQSVDKPPESDLLDLLPQGSNWSQAIGWRSFFGIPYRFGERLWLALGLVKILEHDHRGAFPRSEIYLIDFQSEKLGELVNRIGNHITQEDGGDDSIPRQGALMGEAVEPSEHRQMEERILRGAAEAYAEGNKLMFRTAVLAENEIPNSRFLRFFSGESTDESAPQFSRTLYGTVPSIYRDFRWGSKFQIFLERGRTM